MSQNSQDLSTNTEKVDSPKSKKELRKEQKAEKKKDPKYIKKRNIIISTSVIAGAMVIGSASGWLTYSLLHPKQTALAATATEGVVPTDSEIEKSLKNNSLISDYQNEVYKLLNYSLYKQASYSYSMIIGKASVNASGVTQTVQHTTYTTPDIIYNQNISASSFVHTANKFYDKKDGKVESYLGKTSEDWADGKAEHIDYSYDDYIQKFGKLIKSVYYVTSEPDLSKLSETRPIAENYLTADESEYEACQDETKHRINGVFIYVIGPRTTKLGTIEKTDSGYKLYLEMFTDSEVASNPDAGIAAANTYYSVQMRTTGGLKTRPVFSYSKLTVNVDEELNLVSSFFQDSYTAVVGPINSPAKQDMYQYYFHSDTDTFNGVKVNIPTPTDTDFDGFKLFPEE